MTKVFSIGTGLVTPLGSTVTSVLEAIREGRSKQYFSRNGFTGHSFFENIAIEAAQKAISGIEITPNTGFILSTAKGNVEFIGREDISLALSARRIADALGVKTTPIVVSNACISGVAAMLQGMRMIRSGAFDKVIVVGAEVQSPFIETGFDCLKAISPEPCRPFDKVRQGLNLGEAAAAMVLCADEGPWEIVDGVIRNDANHISGPSRTAEGSYKCLRYVLESLAKEDRLSFVSVHGTATPYNDEMEAIAMDRAGLSHVPVCAIKGYFGHTMGAAGLVEVIVCMGAHDMGFIPASKGFGELGVSRPVNISAQERPASGNAIIKLLSGFGGVNGALLLRKGGSL